MTCREAQAFLSDFLDKQLCLCAMAIVRAHVQDCPTCLEEIRRLETLKKLTDVLKAQSHHE